MNSERYIQAIWSLRKARQAPHIYRMERLIRLVFNLIMDILELLTRPNLMPLMLVFLCGYITVRVLVKKQLLKRFSELEKILIGLGIGLLLNSFLFLPLVLTITFWWPSLKANAYMISVSFFSLTSAMLLFSKIQGFSENQLLDKALRVLRYSIVGVFALLLFSCIIGYGTLSWYEFYITQLITQDWQMFANTNFLNVFIFCLGIFLVIVFFFEPLTRKNKEIRSPFRLLELSPLFFKKSTIGFLILVMFCSLLIVPLDKQFNLFTPRMESKKETYYAERGPFDEIVLFIYAERVNPNKTQNNYRFFRLMNKSYTITPPRWHSLATSLYIANPSNTSFEAGENRPFLSCLDDWKRVWVSVPNGVTYHFNFTDRDLGRKLKGIEMSFAERPEKDIFVANLTYWQEVEQHEINIISLVDYFPVGNNSWLERYMYIIMNNADKSIEMPGFEFDRFVYAVVNRTSVKVYYDGHLQPGIDLLHDRLAVWLHIGPRRTANITITLVSYDIS